MSEYVGSRISLVSKSDIRYVGTLKDIDSASATVSLQDVQCHGTEGRKGNPAEEIPGSDQVYDGIVFRGSDVKDLTIISPPKENRPPQPPQMPNDPAILGSSESHQPPPQQPQPQQQNQNQFRGPPPPFQQQQQQFGYQGQPPNQFQQPPRFQGPGGAHGFPGQPGAVPGYGMNYGPPPPGYGMGPGMGFGPPPGPFQQGPPGGFPPQQQPVGPPGQQMNQQRPQQMPPNQQPPIGSKQNTPQPATTQGSQPPDAQAQTKPAEMSTTPIPASAGPPPPNDSKPSTAAATAPPAAPQAPSQAPTAPKPRTSNKVAVPLTASPAVPKPRAPAARPQPPAPVAQPAAPPQTATEAATAAVAAAMAKLGNINQAGAVDNLTQKVNQMRVNDDTARGRGRGRGGPRGGARGGRRESAQKSVEIPKEDFDFESSNAKFNKQELAKEAIATGSPLASPTNGDKPDPIANGHTNGVEDVVIPPKPVEKGYDKKSSFFDNISSDLKDRVEQQTSGDFVDGRAMRNQERARNMDTFGQGSVDGGYRGRGRGRGRGFGRGGRGYYNNRGGFENQSRGAYRGRGRGGAEAAAV